MSQDQGSKRLQDILNKCLQKKIDGGSLFGEIHALLEDYQLGKVNISPEEIQFLMQFCRDFDNSR